MAERRAIAAGAAALLAVAVVGGGYAADHFVSHRNAEDRAAALTGGDPLAGKAAIGRRPCGGCHVIPGVPGAKGRVGPPLTAFAGRGYIAGRAANQPDALIRFLQDPQSIDPQTAMPPMGIDAAEARDIAAYLYTLG